jgi:hypothetical protein
MKKIFFISIVVLITSCKGLSLRPEITKLVQQIESYNRLDQEHVGFGGQTTIQYKNFIKLRDEATTDELLKLLKHKNPVVRGYTSWALADRKYPKLSEVIIPFIETGDTVSTMHGCEVFTNELSSELYYRIFYQGNFNKLTIKDSLFFNSQLDKIDSFIIHTRKRSTLIDEVLENNNANPQTYFRVKELALEKVESAIIALSKYRKQEDIPLFIELGENSFRAISFFPDKAFWNFLLKYKDSKKSQDYFLAIASYQDKNALKLFNEIYPTCDSVAINRLDESLIKYYCKDYQNLILKIWENAKTIDLTVTNRLIKDCPEKSSISFAKGLLNNKAFNFLELDSNYGTKDSIVPLMLNNIAKYNSNSIFMICKKNIATANFMNLACILDFIKNNHIIETKQNLLNRLIIKNYPFELFQITETLLSFKDSNINKQIVEILKKDKDNWDSGNWAENFRKLLAENNLEIN